LPETLVAVGTGLGDCLSGRESLPCSPGSPPGPGTQRLPLIVESDV